MAELEIRIGGRPFTVACQPGEEKFLEAAARLLDIEATALVDQLGKMPEAQMLLMAGLMLADKTSELEERVRKGGGPTKPATGHLTLPEGTAANLAALAERAEKLANAFEAKAAG